MQRVTLGHAWGSVTWGRGYVGLNLRKEPNGDWSYFGDGAENDGVAIYTSKNELRFCIKPSTGGANGTTTDTGIVNNVVLNLNGALRTLTIGQNKENNIQQVSIGPAEPGNTMWGGGYIGFNMERNANGQWRYKGDGGSSNGGFLIYANGGGSLNFVPKSYTGGNSGYLTDINARDNIRLQIHSSGRVLIGDVPNIPVRGDYSLYVSNGIMAERVRVAVKTTQAWADYVFAPDYPLIPLHEVDAFVKANGHLPGVPSADEVVKEGIDAAQMDAKLLEKIEELTLHLIAQEKKIAELESQVKRVKRSGN